MLKHVYKAIVLAAIFAVAVFFMGKNMKEVTIDENATVKMGEATLPVIYLKTGDYTVNLLRGYSGSLEANAVREAMTPLGADKTLRIDIQENQSDIRKLKYEIRTAEGNELVEQGAISALDTTDTGKSAQIKFKENLDTGREYAALLTVTTNTSKKINYYTRIKYYEEDSFLKEKVDFVTQFHESIMNKKKADEVARYLEPQATQENDTLAKINIHSSLDLVSWGNLKPEVITEIVPTIKEFNIETAAIELSYFVSAKTESGTEVYQVKEFFRVRYTMDRIYLLNYDRTMEELFDMNLASISKSELKVGISGDTDLDMVSSKDNNKMCFVRMGALWYYNLAENQAVKVFSFLEPDADYIRDGYDQHAVRILNMDEGGNIDFLVYGYMNRGDYEGKVAIVLYKYYAGENRIEEQVYAPLETTYQMLKEDLNSFSYVNKKGVFYFTIHNQVYSYNIISKKLTVVASNVSSDNFIILEESSSIAWLDTEDPAGAGSVTILNLETEKTRKLEAGPGDTIRILGAVDTNIIYGYAKTSNITETRDGTQIIPVYQLMIADMEGNILKTYQKKNSFITGVTVRDNVIKLDRVKKTGQNGKISYQPVSTDSILTKLSDKQESMGITSRVTEKAYKELYISLPEGFIMQEVPKVQETLNTVITEDTTLHLENIRGSRLKYYVYALGRVQTAFSNASEAIVMADEQMGVVIDSNNQIVWERGGRYNRKTIAGIKEIHAGNGVDSVGACIGMMLKYNLVTRDAKELSQSGKSIYELLKSDLDSPVNLTGCSLDEILYFISSGRPVIAMKDSSRAVLLNGYDEYYVTMIDPLAGTTVKQSIANADTMFREAGNVFISYMNH